MKRVLLGGVLAIWPVVVLAEAVAVVRPPAKPVMSVPTAQSLQTAAPETEPALTTAIDTEAGGAEAVPRFVSSLRPPARHGNVPRTRWQHMSGHVLWTRAALSALKDHGRPLVDLVPRDIAAWCPAYADNDEAKRRAFWVGFLSALAKHESTYRPWAVGGGGRWYGLLQILPATARGYKCRVGTGAALKSGPANLSCALRIMAHTVPRDGVIHGYRGRKGQGVTTDWGPMHSAAKRGDMQLWLKRQSYCQPVNATRPRARPGTR